MAYLKPIRQPSCKCGKKATVTLVDRWNGERGEYCKRCGQHALKTQTANENPTPKVKT